MAPPESAIIFGSSNAMKVKNGKKYRSNKANKNECHRRRGKKSLVLSQSSAAAGFPTEPLPEEEMFRLHIGEDPVCLSLASRLVPQLHRLHYGLDHLHDFARRWLPRPRSKPLLLVGLVDVHIYCYIVPPGLGSISLPSRPGICSESG